MQMDSLSLTFQALSDPTRRAILQLLSDGEKSVKELLIPFDITAPALTKHLKVLEKSGLISRSREAQWRPCKLETKPLEEASVWMDQYKKDLEERLNQLDQYINQIQQK